MPVCLIAWQLLGDSRPDGEYRIGVHTGQHHLQMESVPIVKRWRARVSKVGTPWPEHRITGRHHGGRIAVPGASTVGAFALQRDLILHPTDVGADLARLPEVP